MYPVAPLHEPDRPGRGVHAVVARATGLISVIYVNFIAVFCNFLGSPSLTYELSWAPQLRPRRRLLSEGAAVLHPRGVSAGGDGPAVVAEETENW